MHKEQSKSNNIAHATVSDIHKLSQWFASVKRDFPWRKNPTPYRVWVAEVMLQQTQASVVVAYFLRWMEKFPSLSLLAQASLDEVLVLWEGLGYYTRARNLLRGARYIAATYQGEFPSAYEALARIPGLGPYTIRAIQSFAFHQKVAPVDANVSRVCSRYYGIEGDISRCKTQKNIQECAETFLPQEAPWSVAEALIELGAMVCKKQPACLHCPLSLNCFARIHNMTDRLPEKPVRPSVITYTRYPLVIIAQEYCLAHRIGSGQVMADLFEFPQWDELVDNPEERGRKALGLNDLVYVKALPSISQSFTRFRVKLIPLLFCLESLRSIPTPLEWLLLPATNYPFSQAHRKVLALAMQHYSIEAKR